jgi:hypothetical protein
MTLKDAFGKTIISVDKMGKIQRGAGASIVMDTKNTAKYLHLYVYDQGANVGELFINFVGAKISFSRDDALFNDKVNNTKNTILVLLKTNNYGYNNNQTNSTLYYNDPFASTNTAVSNVEDSYTNFSSKEGT